MPQNIKNSGFIRQARSHVEMNTVGPGKMDQVLICSSALTVEWVLK